MNIDEDSPENWRAAADRQWVETLLRAALRPHPQADEARVRRVLEAVNGDAARGAAAPLPCPAAPRRTARSSRVRARRRWLSLALAAALLLAVGLWWQGSDPSRRAHAAVQRSLAWVAASGPRHYRWRALVRRPLLGEREISGDLYIDGAERFALRHPALLPRGDLWIGGNRREHWIIPPRGPVLRGDVKMLRNWLANREPLATPYLHLTTVLTRMSEAYRLEPLADESLADPAVPGRQVVCRRIRGLRNDSAGERLPRAIDLWAERDSGIVRRLRLDWRLPPEALGRDSLVLDLMGRPDLPRDWFEHSSHHHGRAVISPKG